MKPSPCHLPGDGDTCVLMQDSVLPSHQKPRLLLLHKSISIGTGSSLEPTLRWDRPQGRMNSHEQMSPTAGVTSFGENQYRHLFSKHILQLTSYRWT